MNEERQPGVAMRFRRFGIGMKKFLCCFGGLILLWVLLATTSRAALVQVDDRRYGPGALTVDTARGLMWLDLSLSSGLSYSQAEQATEPGGFFEGFRHATVEEVLTLCQSAGIPDPGFYPESSPILEPILSFVSLLGSNTCNEGHAGVAGITGTKADWQTHWGFTLHFIRDAGIPGYWVDGMPGGLRATALADTVPFPTWGNWLVRAVPERGAMGFSIDSVYLRPSGSIAPSNEVSLVVTVLTPGYPAFLAQLNEVVVDHDEVIVILHPDCGEIPAVGFLSTNIALGRLSLGSYHFVVALVPAFPDEGEGTKFVEGTFVVVPSLEVQMDSAGMFLRWPKSEDTFVIQYAETLSYEAEWRDLIYEQETAGDFFVARISTSEERMFFRLIQREEVKR